MPPSELGAELKVVIALPAAGCPLFCRSMGTTGAALSFEFRGYVVVILEDDDNVRMSGVESRDPNRERPRHRCFERSRRVRDPGGKRVRSLRLSPLTGWSFAPPIVVMV